MHPAYTWINSYPHHASPMRYARNDDPKAKEITPHMKMDPGTMHSPYPQPFLYGPGYSCPVPHDYHSCCNHGYYGGGPCTFQPHYPHYPPPPPFQAHGVYPPFLSAYPSYHIPPPHYLVEQPKYDYDKNNHSGHHCCGCNHREDDKKLKIEQQEPKVDKDVSDSLVPAFLKDYPYPIMWVPPGYTKSEPKAMEKEKDICDTVSLNLLEPSKRGGNGVGSQDWHDEDGKHFPFPIFGFPSKNNETGNKAKEKDLSLVAHKDLPDETKRQTRKNDEGSGSEAESERSTKHAVQKVIPVKQLDTTEAKETPKVIERRPKSDYVEKADDGREGKGSRKTSKLPPVCLRIDPLPRKKGSSRSPSPPADKQSSKGLPSVPPLDSSKSAQQQTQPSKDFKKNGERSKSDIKTIQVMDDVNTAEKVSVSDPCENAPRGQGNGSGKGMVCKVETKNLSEDEAALIIQSAYRGFEVRKSQPLMKLKQINEVKTHVVDLRKRIQDHGSSSLAIRIDDKQRLIIGETIMSLLLKLDTIQGLHPIVRDVRKSLAKELVGLQEKLDSLTFVKSETPCEQTIMSTSEQDSSVNVMESNSDLCDNDEQEATESQQLDGDAENGNTGPQVPQVELCNDKSAKELNDDQLQVSVEDKQSVNDEAINDKFVQVQVQPESSKEEASEFDTGVLKDHEVETATSVHGIHDAQLDRLVEKSTADLKNRQLQNLMETELPVDNGGTNTETESNDGGEEISDVNLQAQVEPGSQHGTIEVANNQLEMLETGQPVEQEKSDQTQDQSDRNLDSGRVKICEVKDTNSVHEHHNIKLNQMVERQTVQPINNQTQMSVETEAPVENGIQQIPDEAEFGNNIEFAEVHDIDLGTIELTHNQLEVSEIEQPVQEENSDQMQSQLESDHLKSEESCENPQIEEVCEHPQIEVKISQDDVNLKTREEKLDNEPFKVLADTMVEDELPKDDTINGVQEDFVVSTEEAPKVDDVDSSTEAPIEDHGGALPLSLTRGLSSNGDRKLMEENEKLRVAVEELLKAGNEQLGVIRELTGKVKHLEKKLSKKKKIKVNKCKSRAGSVVDELRSYIV